MLYRLIELILILAVYFATFWTNKKKKRSIRWLIIIGAIATITIYLKNWSDTNEAIQNEQANVQKQKMQYDTLNNQYSIISDSLTLALQELRRESDQVDSLMKLSKSGLEQMNKTISGKNDLSLLSARPELVIKPSTQTDLKRNFGSIDSSLSLMKANLYLFYYTIENIGGSSAIIDSIIFEWDWRNKYLSHCFPSDGTILARDSKLVEKYEIVIDTTINTVLGLSIFYSWAESKYSSLVYKTSKYYQFEYFSGKFSIGTITPSYFRDIVDAIPDSSKFIVQHPISTGAFFRWLISK
jgi:hypothetical protein